MATEIEKNYNEAKKIRRILVSHAVASLRANCGELARHPKGVKPGPAEPGLPADARKPTGRRRRRVEKVASGESSPHPALKSLAGSSKEKSSEGEKEDAAADPISRRVNFRDW